MGKSMLISIDEIIHIIADFDKSIHEVTQNLLVHNKRIDKVWAEEWLTHIIPFYEIAILTFLYKSRQDSNLSSQISIGPVLVYPSVYSFILKERMHPRCFTKGSNISSEHPFSIYNNIIKTIVNNHHFDLFTSPNNRNRNSLEEKNKKEEELKEQFKQSIIDNFNFNVYGNKTPHSSNDNDDFGNSLWDAIHNYFHPPETNGIKGIQFFKMVQDSFKSDFVLKKMERTNEPGVRELGYSNLKYLYRYIHFQPNGKSPLEKLKGKFDENVNKLLFLNIDKKEKEELIIEKLKDTDYKFKKENYINNLILKPFEISKAKYDNGPNWAIYFHAIAQSFFGDRKGEPNVGAAAWIILPVNIDEIRKKRNKKRRDFYERLKLLINSCNHRMQTAFSNAESFNEGMREEQGNTLHYIKNKYVSIRTALERIDYKGPEIDDFNSIKEMFIETSNRIKVFQEFIAQKEARTEQINVFDMIQSKSKLISNSLKLYFTNKSTIDIENIETPHTETKIKYWPDLFEIMLSEILCNLKNHSRSDDINNGKLKLLFKKEIIENKYYMIIKTENSYYGTHKEMIDKLCGLNELRGTNRYKGLGTIELIQKQCLLPFWECSIKKDNPEIVEFLFPFAIIEKDLK